jgi:hypothetical protein
MAVRTGLTAASTPKIEPQIQWVAPSPLWQQVVTDHTQMQRPALLRFASDNFMQDLITLLDTTPDQLSDYLATYESFSVPLPGEESASPPDPLPTLKLYQPVHGHFCLVAANLVCQVIGLPDRYVDAANGDQVRFVMRRLRASDQHEMAWVPADTGPGRQWKEVNSLNANAATTLGVDALKLAAPGEEQLPMFPVQFTTKQGAHRRLIVGLIPTSSRESYQAATEADPLVQPTEIDPGIGGQPTDARYVEFDTKVLGGVRGVRAAMDTALQSNLNATEIQSLTESALEAFLFMLLDFADFLAQQLPPVWQAVQALGGGPAPGTKGAALVTLLHDQSQWILPTVQGASAWRDALINAWTNRRDIITEALGTFHPPSYDLESLTTAQVPDNLLVNLGQTVNAALREYTAQAGTGGGAGSSTAQTAVSAEVPKLDARPGTQYVLRCVFQRPRCAPLHPDVVSNRTVPFTIAPYFDFDAPSRPIRISMPMDTSIVGLRKFNKNVAFLISDQLRKQMSRATDLKSMMDGKLADEQQFDLGVICSFSIPIITICALILLLIIINLLNIIFWWLPLFRICLPIGLKRG